MQKLLTETQILENMKEEALKDYVNVDLAMGELVAKATLGSITDNLASWKSTNKPVAIVIKSEKGDFITAAIVKHHAPVDNDEGVAGNWSYTWTFNEADLEGADVHDIVSTNTHTSFERRAIDIAACRLTAPNLIPRLIRYFITNLIGWLDVNAKEGEEVSVVCEGYFTATVNVIDGEKVFEIQPSEQLMADIKSDLTLSQYADAVA